MGGIARIISSITHYNHHQLTTISFKEKMKDYQVNSWKIQAIFFWNSCRGTTGLENRGYSGRRINKIPGQENSGKLIISCFYHGKIREFQNSGKFREIRVTCMSIVFVYVLFNIMFDILFQRVYGWVCTIWYFDKRV